MKVVIDRATWRCGGSGVPHYYGHHGEGHTQLLNEQGFMCCLGFHAMQAGCPASGIRHICTPCELFTREYSSEPDVILWGFLKKAGLVRDKDRADNSEFSDEAMEINDAKISYAERETELQALAEAHGHTYEFVGKYLDEEE